MRRTVLLAALCIASLLPCASDAYVVPREDPAEGHLPLDTFDERMLIAQARGLAATQAAIRMCQERGYIAHPEADRAVVPQPGRIAVCFLGFEKPGYVPPPHSLGAPVIMVATIQVADGLMTRVSAGFVILDGDRGTWRVYDPDVGGYDGHGPSIADRPIEIDPNLLTELEEERLRVITGYAACAGFGNAGCVAGGIVTGLAATPVVGVLAGVACIATNTGACLSHAISAWPAR